MRSASYIRRPTRRPNGQGVVRLSGKDIYLGVAGDWPKGRKSPPAAILVEYEALVARWLANNRTLPEDDSEGVSVDELILAYDTFAQSHYHRDGKASSHLHMVRDALKIVRVMFGSEPAADFGPKKLKRVQECMTRQNWSRTYVNEQVARVRRMFKWAVSEELVPGTVFHALQAVQGVRKGTQGVKESKPVKPVPEATVDATLPHLPPVIRAMVRFQLLTGCRPGEACMLRACDLDTTSPVWTYRPASHKTEHHGRSRLILVGPQAQAVILPFITTNQDAYLFSPSASEAARNADRKKGRKSPMTPSQAKRKPKRKPARPKREKYDETSYRNAIYRACDKAFTPPEPLCRRDGETAKQRDARLTGPQKTKLADWCRSARWHPNQLRHTTATRVRKEFGIETARAVLGHAKLSVTEVYAEQDREAAAQAMAKLG